MVQLFFLEGDGNDCLLTRSNVFSKVSNLGKEIQNRESVRMKELHTFSSCTVVCVCETHVRDEFRRSGI